VCAKVIKYPNVEDYQRSIYTLDYKEYLNYRMITAVSSLARKKLATENFRLQRTSEMRTRSCTTSSPRTSTA